MSERAPKAGLPGLERLAHDLRGPLAPLQTAAYLLRSDQLDDARRGELHELIERQVRRMGAMIDELDDWLRAGQDRLLGSTARVEPVPLLEVAMTASGCTDGPAPDIDDDSLLAAVVGDQRRLVQLLRTLLEHARAVGGAPPRVRVRNAGDALQLDVVSKGGGDGADGLLSRPQDDHREDGLGLRLMVAQAIAEAHGGSLEACAEDGDLCLCCRLPLADAAR